MYIQETCASVLRKYFNKTDALLKLRHKEVQVTEVGRMKKTPLSKIITIITSLINRANAVTNDGLIIKSQ